MSEETITITKKKYDNMLYQCRILAALEAGGVDNWDWYSESLRDAGLFDDEDEDDDEG